MREREREGIGERETEEQAHTIVEGGVVRALESCTMPLHYRSIHDKHWTLHDMSLVTLAYNGRHLLPTITLGEIQVSCK